MIAVRITGDLQKASKDIANMVNFMLRRSDSFLVDEQPRLAAHAEAIVRTTVYDVYDPVEYIRTYQLLNSMKARFPNKANTKEIWIESDPTIASAVAEEGGVGEEGGYAKYVAGEGPGIGFLKPFYGGADDRRPSHFPRKFHEAMVNLASNVYSNLESDLRRRYIKRVITDAQRYMR